MRKNKIMKFSDIFLSQSVLIIIFSNKILQTLFVEFQKT